VARAAVSDEGSACWKGVISGRPNSGEAVVIGVARLFGVFSSEEATKRIGVLQLAISDEGMLVEVLGRIG
jgi:hypothetical protein